MVPATINMTTIAEVDRGVVEATDVTSEIELSLPTPTHVVGVHGNEAPAAVGTDDAATSVRSHPMMMALDTDSARVLRGRPRAMATLSAAMAAALALWFTAAAIADPLHREWGTSLELIGLLTAMVNCGFVVGCAAMTAHAAADMPRPQTAVTVGLVGASATTALLAHPGAHTVGGGIGRPLALRCVIAGGRRVSRSSIGFRSGDARRF